MSFVSEMRFVSFLRPCTILTSSGLSFPASWDIALGITWIRCYECSILDDAFLYIISVGLELINELRLDEFKHTVFFQSFVK
jgi:hypothetical protein